jgi:hypothetical protein
MGFSEKTDGAARLSGGRRGVRRPLGGIWPTPEGAVGRLLEKIGLMDEPHY